MTEIDTEYKESFYDRLPKFDIGNEEKQELYDARAISTEDTTTFSAKSSGEVKRYLENMSRYVFENEISGEKLLGADVDGHCFLQLFQVLVSHELSSKCRDYETKNSLSHHDFIGGFRVPRILEG